MNYGRPLGLFTFALFLLGACGGKLTNPEGGADNRNGDETSGGSSQEPCPTIDYCALRCSPSAGDIPLYPPHCNIPTCSCLVGVNARDDWSGTYSLDRSVDAINVKLEPNGTFHWTLESCDVSAGDCGEWRKSQPHVITLLPSAGRKSFLWPSGDSVEEHAQLLVTNPDDKRIAVEHPEPGAKPFFDSWVPGRTCASCEGGRKTKIACATPVARVCH